MITEAADLSPELRRYLKKMARLKCKEAPPGDFEIVDWDGGRFVEFFYVPIDGFLASRRWSMETIEKFLEENPELKAAQILHQMRK